MSKHTPAPWWTNGREVGTAPTMAIKVARVSGATPEEMKANAHLMAAAPQMLEALEELEPFLQWLVIERGDKVDKLLKNKILPAIKPRRGRYEDNISYNRMGIHWRRAGNKQCNNPPEWMGFFWIGFGLNNMHAVGA